MRNNSSTIFHCSRVRSRNLSFSHRLKYTIFWVEILHSHATCSCQHLSKNSEFFETLKRRFIYFWNTGLPGARDPNELSGVFCYSKTYFASILTNIWIQTRLELPNNIYMIQYFQYSTSHITVAFQMHNSKQSNSILNIIFSPNAWSNIEHVTNKHGANI